MLLLHLLPACPVLGAQLLKFLLEARLLVGCEDREDLIVQRVRSLGIARAPHRMLLGVLAEDVLDLLLLLSRETDRR